jgi:hypothetical protein
MKPVNMNKLILLLAGLVFIITVNQAQTFAPIAFNNSIFGQSSNHEECTIGVAIGNVTADGRPLLWKTRDFASSLNNEVKYNTSFKYKFICVSDSATSTLSWMGVNEHGFAIVNSESTDLPTNSTGPGDGTLMRDVLGNCLTVLEFQKYLDSTNTTGRATAANFAVIDSAGAAAIFETGGNVYYRFNADTAAHGYLIRTNFSVNGGGSAGIQRYNRSSALIDNFYKGDTLDYKSILRYQMRDFSDSNSNPISVPYQGVWESGVPYGYIYSDYSICREASVAAAVIQGVKPTEHPGLSTMWTILGQPATSVAIPYWPVGVTPADADGSNTAPLCNEANEIRARLFNYSTNVNYINTHDLLNGQGSGLWTCLFPLEDYILTESQQYIDSLRLLTALPVSSMLNKEADNDDYVLLNLQNCMNSITGINNESELNDLIKVFPNPTRDEIQVISNQLSVNSIEIFNSLGEKIYYSPITDNRLPITINISDIPSGVYFVEVNTENGVGVKQFVKE